MFAIRRTFSLGIVRIRLGDGFLSKKYLYRMHNFSLAASASKETLSPIENIKETVTSRQQVRFNVLDEYVESINEPITTENIGFLYECISRYMPHANLEQKADLIAKLWAKVKTWKSPSEDDYASWLRACRECKVRMSIDGISEELGSYEPSLKLYEEILYLTSSIGDSEETLEVLDYIKEEGFPLTEKIFNALIVAHSRDKNVESFESVLELMNSANLTPNDETKYEMVRAYIINDLWENAEQIINLMTFQPRQLMEILRCSVTNSASVEFLSMLIKKFPIDLINSREISPIFRNFIIELIHREKRPLSVLQVIDLLPKPHPSPTENEDVYGGFILNELFEAEQPFEVLKSVCDFLVTNGRNPRAPFVVTEMSLRRNSPLGKEFLKYLSEFEPLKPHYFWPLIIKEFESNGEQGVLDLIKEMKTLGLKEVDAETIQLYILPRVNFSTEDVNERLQALTKAGIKMSDLIDPLLSQLVSRNRYGDFIKVVKLYPTKFKADQLITPLAKSVSANASPKDVLKVLNILTEKSPNSDIMGTFLLELANNNKFDQLEAMAKEILVAKAKVSQVAKDRLSGAIKMARSLEPEQKTQMMKTIGTLMTSNSAPISRPAYFESKHPNEMSFDELECHLAELEGKGLNARGVIRKMLQMAVKEKRFERALEMKSKCDELKVDLSPGMVASCVEMYSKTGNSQLALKSLETLAEKYPKFNIDEHKVIDLATCLIKEDRFEEARRLITQRAQHKLFGVNNNKNVWHLLTAIGEKNLGKEDENSAKPFLNLLVKLKYCVHSNTLLGPLVREHLNRKDLRGAVAEFKQIAKSHRKTPLNMELFTILVGIKNGNHDGFTDTADVDTMIQDVYSCIESVHGGGAAKMSLLFATAERGTDKQVRKILMDPTTRLEPEALQRQCEYLVLAGKSEPLFRLIKAGRGLSHTAINEHQWLSSLMQTLAQQNNVEDALKLFDRLLDEDDFKVSKQIADILINLLKRNNLELPSRLQTFNV